MLQQHLPFTVLKPEPVQTNPEIGIIFVATAPTVYGIETAHGLPAFLKKSSKLQQHLPFTVLKQIKIIC